MKPFVFFLLLAPSLLHGAYSYYLVDTLASIDTTKWTVNGAIDAWANAPSSTGGSLISTLAVPDGTAEYEIKTPLYLAASGGTYVHYFRASVNALTGPSPAGSFYSAEFTFTAPNTLAISAYKRSAAGVLSLLASTNVWVGNNPVVRTIVWTSHDPSTNIDYTGADILVNGAVVLSPSDDSTTGALLTGKPGVGGYNIPAGNYMQGVSLGALDRVAPAAVNASSIASAVFPNEVNLRWQPSADDANGIGGLHYVVSRNGAASRRIETAEYADATVAPGATYTYGIAAVDAHGSTAAATTFTVTTPPAGAIDPRRIGVRPTVSIT